LGLNDYSSVNYLKVFACKISFFNHFFKYLIKYIYRREHACMYTCSFVGLSPVYMITTTADDVVARKAMTLNIGISNFLNEYHRYQGVACLSESISACICVCARCLYIKEVRTESDHF